MKENKWLMEVASDGTGASGGADGAAGSGAATGGDVKPAWPDNWRSQISTDEKEARQLERYASPADIWKKARALEQRISSGELRSNLPKDATPEQVVAWRKENGIPEDPKGYDVKLDGVEWDGVQKEAIERLTVEMHGANANPSQVKATASWVAKEVEIAKQRQEKLDDEAKRASEDILRTEWGGEYRRNVTLINSLLDTGPGGDPTANIPSLKERFWGGRMSDGKPMATDPDMLKWLASLALQVNPQPTLTTPGETSGQSVDDRIATIEKEMRNRGSDYYKGPIGPSGDTKMAEEYRRLVDWRDRQRR